MTAAFPSLREIARVLGGEVSAGQVLAPGPSHSRADRSMSVRLSPSAPDGFLAFSHAGDDWRVCRDYVRERLGRMADGWKAESRDTVRREAALEIQHDEAKIASALSLWRAGVDPRGTLVERYLAARNLRLAADLAGEVLRWHPGVGAMLALMRNIEAGEPQAVSRRFLGSNGEKLGKPMYLGPVRGAAVMLDAFDTVSLGLHVGEGVETCMTARQLGLRPCWALGSVGTISAFPVLAGIEALTLLAEGDPASSKATRTCGERWHAGGREVIIVEPRFGNDLNDAIQGADGG